MNLKKIINLNIHLRLGIFCTQLQYAVYVYTDKFFVADDWEYLKRGVVRAMMA